MKLILFSLSLSLYLKIGLADDEHVQPCVIGRSTRVLNLNASEMIPITWDSSNLFLKGGKYEVIELDTVIPIG